MRCQCQRGLIVRYTHGAGDLSKERREIGLMREIRPVAQSTKPRPRR